MSNTQRAEKLEKLRQMIRDAVPCPECGADFRQPCSQKNGTKVRLKNHQARVDAFNGKAARPKKKRAKSHRKPDDFYTSWEWKRVRYEALRIHGQRCQCCGWQPGDTSGGRLVVDHIKPRRKFPELALDVENLQVLCNDCNMGKSNVYEDDFRGIDHWLSRIAQDG